MAPKITPEVEREVRRLVTRFSIERVAAGWSVAALAREIGSWRTSVDRAESGEVIPTLPVLIAMGQPVGLRLDWVPEHIRPLLDLDEFEIRALLVGAAHGWRSEYVRGEEHWALTRALRKLGIIHV